MLALAQAWLDRRGELTQTAGKVTEYLRQSEQLAANESELSSKPLDDFARVARHIHDADHGGFGGAPKFPHALELRLLLRIWNRTGEAALLEIVRNSLDHMTRGGIFDQLAGGFHRYSTDDRWLVPHFEKMLYDNALLSAAYLDAFQATGEPFYREITERVLDYVVREMTDPAGPFYATQDADSEGEEGKFYVWTQREIEDALGTELSEPICSVYGVTPGGNWEGRSILCRSKSDEQDARLLGLSVEQLRSKLTESHAKLLDVRRQRVQPTRDEKIITAWNGLMLSSFARAGALFDRPDYVAVAERSANYLLDHLRGPDGRLFRTSAVGKPAHLVGCLDDYAALTDSLVTLYEATFAERWLHAANEFAAVMVDQFEDREHGGFFTTGTDHERLPVRLKDQHDGSTPSGNGLAVTALVRLALYTGESKWSDAAERCLRRVSRPHGGATVLDCPDADGSRLASRADGPNRDHRRSKESRDTAGDSCSSTIVRSPTARRGLESQRPRVNDPLAARQTRRRDGDDIYLSRLRLRIAARGGWSGGSEAQINRIHQFNILPEWLESSCPTRASPR